MLLSFQLGVFLSLVLAGLIAALPSATSKGPDDLLADIALDNVYKVLNGTIQDGSTRNGCTKEKLAVRKE
jgi:tyrosinase